VKIMDEIETLREAWPAPEPPSPQAYQAARAQLLASASGAPARRAQRRGRRLGLWAGGATTAAALAAAVVFSVLPGGTAPAPAPGDSTLSAGQELLFAAATVARSQPETTGTYWHVKAQSPEGTWEYWTAHDGMQYGLDGTEVVFVSWDGIHAGSRALTAEELADLPTDAAALQAWILDSFDHPTPRQLPGQPAPPVAADQPIPADELPGVTASALIHLLWEVPTPPAVRAAAFDALAALPDVTSLGAQDGGEALRISFPPPPADKYPGGVLPEGADHMTVVIDPDTSQLMSVTNYQGTVDVLTAEWTDDMPPVATP